MTEDIIAQINNAEARVLATSGPHGVNAVPVSVVEVMSGKIQLYNFFMGKSVENLQADPEVSFSCWKGFVGIQVKATAAYMTNGEQFESAVPVMKERFPDRTLHGVIVLTPSNIFDISASNERAGKLLSV